MTRRKRKHIPLIQKLASALADKLPQAERDALRSAKVPASQIVRMFTPDHIRLHAWSGSDKWHNLNMRIRDASLKAKDAADTSRAAKVVRVQTNERGFALIGPKKARRKTKASGRSIQNRGFQKPPEGYRHNFGRRST